MTWRVSSASASRGSRAARQTAVSFSTPSISRPASPSTPIRACRISWPNSRASWRVSRPHASAISSIRSPAGSAEFQDLLVLELVNRAKPQVMHLTRARHAAPGTPVPVSGRPGRRDGDLRRRRPAAAGLPDLPASGAARPAFVPLISTHPQAADRSGARSRARRCPCPCSRTRAESARRPRRPRPSCSRARRSCSRSRAAMANEQVRSALPAARRDRTCRGIQGSLELARCAVSGWKPLPVAPRQIPYHAGMTYFELDRSNAYWQRLPARRRSSSASRATGPSSRSNAGRSGTEPWPRTTHSACMPRATGRMVIRPQPGGRPPAEPLRTTPPAPTATVSHRRWSSPQAPGRNPSCQAALPILTLAPLLRSPTPPADPESLRSRLQAELDRYREVGPRTRAAIRLRPIRPAWALAALLDDIVLNTPWGAASAWGRRSLVASIWSETDAGERFFEATGAPAAAARAAPARCWRSSIVASPWALRAATALRASDGGVEAVRRAWRACLAELGGSAGPDAGAALAGRRGRRQAASSARAAMGDRHRDGGAAVRGLHRLSLSPQ